MYSESCRTIAAMLNGYISSCSPEQVQELKRLLIDTISDIDNDNLTQEKSIESEQENKSAEPEKQRAPKIPIDKNLAQRIYEAAKKRPKAKQKDIEKSLKLNKGMIGKRTKRVYFMGEYRTLANIFTLGQLMSGRNAERYKREIKEDYEE